MNKTIENNRKQLTSCNSCAEPLQLIEAQKLRSPRSGSSSHTPWLPIQRFAAWLRQRDCSKSSNLLVQIAGVLPSVFVVRSVEEVGTGTALMFVLLLQNLLSTVILSC